MQNPGFSYWEIKTFFAHQDAVIIGAGIVGLSAAIELKRKHPDWRIMVLERDMFSLGASSRNAGFACFGSPSELLDDLKIMSEDQVFHLVERRFRGLENLMRLLGKEALRADQHGGFEIFRAQETELYNACLDQLSYLNLQLKHLCNDDVYRLVNPREKDWPFANSDYAIENRYEYGIDTGSMLFNLGALARQEGVQVLYGVEVESIEDAEKAIFRLRGSSFETDRLIICTNAFAPQLIKEIPVIAARNQVIVTEAVPELSLNGCFHVNRGYIYFRQIDQRILLGGFRHLSREDEYTDSFGLTSEIQSAMEDFLHSELYPKKKLKIEYRWSGIMGLGNQKTTIVKRLSDHIYCGVRMGGMGVAIGSLVGKELSQLIE